MYKKSAVLLLALILLSLSLSGCLRPASTPPASAQGVGTTPTTETAFPQATQPAGNVQSILNQTQTAAVLAGTPAEAVATATKTKQPKAVATAKPTKKPAKENNEEKSSFQPNLNPEKPATYTLKPGEFPICIARRYNLDVPTLLSINGLAMDSRPKSGTKLRIPQEGSWNLGSRALHDHPAQYTVKSGDTFYTIACYFGNLLPDDIAQNNGYKVTEKPSAGTVLDIP